MKDEWREKNERRGAEGKVAEGKVAEGKVAAEKEDLWTKAKAKMELNRMKEKPIREHWMKEKRIREKWRKRIK